MIGKRTLIHFLILIGLGLGGVVVARNYNGFMNYLTSINLKETFRDECLAEGCPDTEAEMTESDSEPAPEKPTEPATKAKVDAKAKTR